MRDGQRVPAYEYGTRMVELSRRVHETGEMFYLMDRSKALAAIVPVGFKATAMPFSALDAAYDAAFPGLPHEMTEGQARRRLRADLNAAYPHLADALEKAEQRGARLALEGSLGQQI